MFNLGTTIMERALRDFLMLYQTILSPQVKQKVIISSKQGKFDLLNDLYFRILENKGKSGKSQNLLQL